MENTNTQPTSIPEASTPTSTPSSSTPTSTQTAPAPKQKFDIKKLIPAFIIIGLVIAYDVGVHIYAKASFDKRMEEVNEICEKHGGYSSQCTDIIKKNDVDCNYVTGECTDKKKYLIIF